MAQSRKDIRFGDLGRGFQIGISNGPIHLPPERPKTPPSPSSTVPFLRDPDYVDRQALLEQVHAKCSIPASRTALVGLGGVGKSQVAIEFSYHVRGQSPGTWVFWVHASNAARIEQSYREIADRVKISSRNDPKANVYNLVHNWLCDKTKGRWCLILDNLDDYRVLDEVLPIGQDAQESTRRPLLSYLPQSDNGSIIITTRSMNVALRLVEQSNIIEVQPMDVSHAIALFEKKLGKQSDDNDVAELVGALEFMPLAIVQAAAYISQHAPRSSVQQYLEEFRKSDRKRTSLLNYDAGHLRRDREAKNSIITTWQISFEYIYQVRPSAADLLSLMSFYDRQSIPETLIRCRDLQQKHGRLDGSDIDNEVDSEDYTSESTENDGFEEDVLMLRSYSFISANADQIVFEMHRLVQLATQTWLISHARFKRWKRQFIKNLAFEFPVGEYDNWARCESLFPHAKSALAQQPDEKDSLEEWASLLNKAAWYALERGNMSDAEKMAGQAMKASRKLFGADHPSTLTSMANLASAYRNQGRWDEAEKLQVEVMETRKTKLGMDHPDTLTSMANLAATYWNQGRWGEAEKLEVQVMEALKTKLGTDHPHTLTTMANLASTYRDRGRWEEAEKLEVEAMETRKTKLGGDHPDTLNSMANLALTFLNQGRWDEAEKLEMEVVETRKTKLGMDHPDTLTSMANLASTYWNQGRWGEAEKLQVEVMKTSKTKLGADHPDTLTSIGQLAATYRHQGRLDEAEPLEVKVMKMRKTKLGVDHPSTLTSMSNLASTYRDQGRWDKAEKLDVEVMETLKTKFGVEHPSTLISMANLASTYWNQGRWDEAERLDMEVMEMGKTKLGVDHPDTLTSMNNLAFTWKSQGRDTEALELMKECVQRKTQILGIHHPNTKSSSTVLKQWKSSRVSRRPK